MPTERPRKLTTAQVAPVGMAPHGHVEMWFDGDFLQYAFTGPFNVELINALAKAQLAFLARETRLTPWVSLCTMSGSAVGSPEAFARYHEILAAPKPPGSTPIGTAFIIGPEVEGGRMMLPRYVAIFKAIGRPFASFETMTEARAWGQSLLDAAKA